MRNCFAYVSLVLLYLWPTASANGQNPQFKIQVDRSNGQIQLFGDSTVPLETQGYSIFSDAGALNSDLWQSVSATGDANSGGSFDPSRNWVEFTADGSRTDLSEGVLGVSTIAPSTSPHNLGTDVWIRFWQEELRFEYLDGNGVLKTGIVEFVGNGGQPFGLADLTFDGVLDEQDWLGFVDGLGGEFPDLSIAEAYQLGDLNADRETNHDDFVIFHQRFDSVNGPGAFEKMLASIPEPSPLVLIGTAMAFGFSMFRKRCHSFRSERFLVESSCVSPPATLVRSIRRPALRNHSSRAFSRYLVDSKPPSLWEIQSTRLARRFLLFVIALVVSCVSLPRAEAQILLTTDFEGLPLADSPLASDDDNESDWTANGPTGWTTDDRTTPSDPARPEFQGWNFLDQTFWVNQQGTQVGRADFLPGLQPNNTIAVVDPDAHDDFIDNDPNRFSSVLTSPIIDLTGIAPASIQVSFDSSWFPEDQQEAQFNVVIDGIRTNLFTWDSEPNSNFKAPAPNERVEMFVNNAPNASEMYFEWDMVEAGNDWWWAIDNVLVTSTGAPQFLNLLVNPSTGATSIQNNTGNTTAINYYEIQSPSGSLDPADFPSGWNSLDDQNHDAIGGGIGQSWDEGNQSDSFELVEAFLLGSSSLANNDELSIGNAFLGAQGTQDLQFFYASPSGTLVEGTVFYLTPGDFNSDGVYDCNDVDLLTALIANNAYLESFDVTGDGSIDLADLEAWLVEAGAASLDTGNSFLPGDANLDGAVDELDFDVWVQNQFTTSPAWCNGDWNADGGIDLADLHRWNEYKFQVAGNPTVAPEPNGWLMTVFCVGLIGSRSAVRLTVALGR